MSRPSPSSIPRPSGVLFATGYYLRAVHEGVVRYARQAGWVLDASMTHSHRIPGDWRGDGVLALNPTPSMARRIEGFNRPTVAMLTAPARLKCPRIEMDNAAAGRLAAEHLLARGFTRFAYYQRMGSAIVNARRASFQAAVCRAGHEFHTLDWAADARRQRRRRLGPWLARRLARLPKPLAVFASGDSWALDVLNACKAASIPVPEQVAVVGVDNDPLYVDIAPVPLSSIDNNLPGVGYRAAELLDRLMAGEKPPTTPIVVPPVGIVTRKSTDILAVEDPHVARAIAFILEHFRRPIGVLDVAATCPVSLRWLQEVFRRSLGRTIGQEIGRLRLDHAMRLLRSTDRKVESIARESGFSTGRYLSRVMADHVGVGPRGYRSRLPSPA